MLSEARIRGRMAQRADAASNALPAHSLNRGDNLRAGFQSAECNGDAVLKADSY